jgi:protein-tyrosine phosphatase
MFTQPYWIEWHGTGRLGVSPRPRGGDWLEDEMKAWRAGGVDVVVSLLTCDEAADLMVESEAGFCKSAGMVFRSFPIEDRGVPNSANDADALLQELTESLRAGKTVLIHCRQGIGRSGLIAVALLTLIGQHIENAVAAVSRARGLTVPETEGQLAWLKTYAEIAPKP